jgi:hypothetical protein
MALLNIGDIGILSAKTDNRGRIDHNNFGGGDNSSDGSWDRSRGHRSHGREHGHKRGGGKGCGK